MKRSLLLFAAVLFLAACSRSFEPVDYGKDACAHCRMTIVDPRFAAELIDGKGKVYKFDDIVCLKHFGAEHHSGGDVLYFAGDYTGTQAGMLDASKVVFLRHEHFRSPMNGHYAAFPSEEEARGLADSLQITPLTFSQIK